MIGTSPAAGTEVDQGTEVIVRISKGNLKLVPGVANKGYDEGQAKAVLTSAGFKLANIQVLKMNTTNQAQDGKVILQDPAEGTPRDPATTTIRITVAEYVDPSPTGSPSPSPARPDRPTTYTAAAIGHQLGLINIETAQLVTNCATWSWPGGRGTDGAQAKAATRRASTSAARSGARSSAAE